MASWRTHMLWGGALAAWSYHLLPDVPRMMLGTSIPPLLTLPLWVGGSAIIAIWPDIDEPSSKAHRLAVRLFFVIGAIIGGMSIGEAGASFIGAISLGSWQLAAWAWYLIGAGIGSIIGWCLGLMALSAIRRGSGGHRRGTHTLLIAIPLLILAGILAPVHLPIALSFAWIGWGIVCHLPPDLLTPQGVPIGYPIWKQEVRLMTIPEWLSSVLGGMGLVSGLIGVTWS